MSRYKQGLQVSIRLVADGFRSQANVKSSDIAFDVSPHARLIVFPADQLSCLVNPKMPCKRIIMVTNYDLGMHHLWDVWKPLVLEHSLNVFPALRKVRRASKKLCFLVAFLQLGELQLHASEACVRIVSRYVALEGVPELAELEKDSCSAYKDLVERGKLTC